MSFAELSLFIASVFICNCMVRSCYACLETWDFEFRLFIRGTVPSAADTLCWFLFRSFWSISQILCIQTLVLDYDLAIWLYQPFSHRKHPCLFSCHRFGSIPPHHSSVVHVHDQCFFTDFKKVEKSIWHLFSENAGFVKIARHRRKFSVFAGAKSNLWTFSERVLSTFRREFQDFDQHFLLLSLVPRKKVPGEK